MAYYFYLGKVLLPIAPSKLQIQINGANKTHTLIDEGEVNVLKSPALTSIEFEALLPNVRYPFAVYKSGFKEAEYFLKVLKRYVEKKRPFRFIVTRKKPNGDWLFNTNMMVSLESYTIKEDAKGQGLDIVVSIKLKQYKSFGTKTCAIQTSQTSADTPKVSMETQRPAENPPEATDQSYTVVKGDSLWKIAKKFYGNGSKYTVIYNANKDKVKNPNVIYPGQVLSIPKG